MNQAPYFLPSIKSEDNSLENWVPARVKFPLLALDEGRATRCLMKYVNLRWFKSQREAFYIVLLVFDLSHSCGFRLTFDDRLIIRYVLCYVNQIKGHDDESSTIFNFNFFFIHFRLSFDIKLWWIEALSLVNNS